MATKKTDNIKEIDVVKLQQGESVFCLLGNTPFYCNKVGLKAKQMLLLPRGRLTVAQKAQSLKHDPEAEFRDSAYLRRGPGPTRIMMKTTAPKKAVAQAAIDMPSGVAKAQIGRLTSVTEEYMPIWGIPRLSMEIVRSSDIAHTPDVRTRAKLDRWAAKVTIRYILPMLNQVKVTTLLSAAGVICGIGDWRQEKGGGSNGLFEVVSEDDPRFVELVENAGIEVQDEAFKNIECADAESEELLAWYKEEIVRRGNEAEEVKRESAKKAAAKAAREVARIAKDNGGGAKLDA